MWSWFPHVLLSAHYGFVVVLLALQLPQISCQSRECRWLTVTYFSLDFSSHFGSLSIYKSVMTLTFSLLLHPPPRRRCSHLCSLVCKQDYTKTTERIYTQRMNLTLSHFL